MRKVLLGGVTLLPMASSTAQVVPAPQRLELGAATCEAVTLRCTEDAFLPQLAALRDGLSRLGAAGALAPTDAPTATVTCGRGEFADPEGYRIATQEGRLVVTAATPRGMARATATLLQLARVAEGRALWPEMAVQDAPDLSFRCFMVDMGRNPHDPQTLRRVVDALWYYKVGFLQLHLTDDQLFSWPSQAFPKLLSPRAGWTREDFVALEAYSQARGVTLIPEIDMPGHSSILRREYPEVFGTTPTELATAEAAERGVERLLDELLSVFVATPYVHVGGDEADVPEDAQRDFINRRNRAVKARGRRTIVWEGPRLGVGAHKVDTDVLHINWNTVDFPAQQMLDAGYEVVNAAWDPLYVVDHYPRTMFTAVPVERCYGWDPRCFAHVDPGMPTFAAPHRTTTAAGIVGFCMPWWEGRQENLLPLCAPRLAAVASAAWNRAGERDFADFERRQVPLLARLQRLLGETFPAMPFADPASQRDNLAYLAKVTPSTGASQPVFGPQRLTNGMVDRFDHFLGYPTAPEPLRIVIELTATAPVARVVVHETAVGGSYEVYELEVSGDGETYEKVGAAGEGSRGERSFVEHRFAARPVRFLRITTRGCHGLTFPSFSRLTEVMAFAQ